MSAASPIRVGVIGVGKMGELHLRKLLSLSDVEVSGIFDADVARRDEVAGRHGVPGASDLATLLFESDAVVIAATTGSHYALGRLALESGTHVLMEKPIAATVGEAEELVRLAEESNLVLQVGLIERFRYRALAGESTRGRVRFIETQRLTPHLARDPRADVVTDLMIHDLDLVLALMGEDPVHVSAIGVRVLTDELDMANVRLEFKTGAAVNMSVSRVSLEPVRKFRVFFEDAYASMDFSENSVKVYSQGPDRSIRLLRNASHTLDPLRDQAADFVECVRTSRRPVVSGQDGLRALRFAKQIVEKIHERTGHASPKISVQPSLGGH